MINQNKTIQRWNIVLYFVILKPLKYSISEIIKSGIMSKLPSHTGLP